MVATAICSYNPHLAEKFGLEEAILLNNFYTWTSPVKDNPNERTYFNGRYWINISLRELKYIFKHMSMSGLRRCLDKMVSQNLLMKDNFNTTYLEKKLWYALTDNAITICQNEQDQLFKTENNIYYISSYNCIGDNKLYLKKYNINKNKSAHTRVIINNNNINNNIYDKSKGHLVKVKAYGKYKNIYLTDKEFDNIQQHFPNPSANLPWHVALDAVSEYLNAYPERIDEIQGKYYYYVTSFGYKKAVNRYKASIGEKIKTEHTKKKPKYTEEQLKSFFTNLDEVEI